MTELSRTCRTRSLLDHALSLESFRFLDEYDYEYEIFYEVHAREPASFWQENVVAVVTLLRVLARMSQWQKQVTKMLAVLPFCDWERV